MRKEGGHCWRGEEAGGERVLCARAARAARIGVHTGHFREATYPPPPFSILGPSCERNMDAENRAEPPDCAAAAKGNQDKCSNELDVDQQSSTLADDSQLWREESSVGDLPLDTFKKKKKPKRVGGIAFAVEEQVQVIQTNQEDLTLRREHWQAIQEKANDPTTVSPGQFVVLACKIKMVH